MDRPVVSGSSPPEATSTGGPAQSWRRWAALAVLCTASFMVILDGAIIIVAVPTIAASLGLSTATVQWAVSGYLLTFGALLLLGGRIADLFGRRRMFMIGTGLFVVSSLFCGLAWSGETLIASRAVQGLSAAIMMPTALSLLLTTFEDGALRNKALGIWGAVGGLGGTAGVLIGGPITDGLGWEWNFFINIPVGLAMMALAPVLLKESRNGGPRTLDLAGATTITAALVVLVYAVVKAPDDGWLSVRTIGLLAASAILIAAFVRIESRSAAPLVPLRIFRSRGLVGGNLVMLAIGMTVFGSNIIITLYAQQVLGYSAIEYGLMTVAMTVMAVVGSILGQGVATKLGVRVLALASMALMTVGALIFTRISPDGSYLADLLLPLIIFGLGLGAGFVAASIAALTGVPDHESGLAAGLNNTAFQLGSALGIAVATTVAVSYTTSGPDQAIALTDGFQAGYVGVAVFAVLGLVAAYLLLRQPPKAAVTGVEPEAAPVPAPVPVPD